MDGVAERPAEPEPDRPGDGGFAGDGHGAAAARLGLLRRRPGFARLLTAEVVSPLGDAMATVALILHLQRTAGTGTAVATVLVAESLPPLFSPYLGALADRFAGRGVLIFCALAQAGVTAVTALALPGIAGLFGLVFLRAAFATVFAAAAGAAVPDLVDDADLPAANALLGGGRELGTIVGPPLAGVLFAVAGARFVLGVDAVTFLVAVPLLAALGLPDRRHRHVDDDHVATTVRADALEGLRYLWRTPVLRALAIGFWLSVLAAASDDLVMAFLAERDLGAGPAGIGVLLAGASVGLVVGLAALSRWGRGLAAMGSVLAGFAIVGAGNLATAAAPSLAAAVATQIVRGGGIALIETNVRTIVQRAAPRHLLGRTLANLYGGVGVAAALGYAIGGPLLDATSPRVMFVVIGSAGLVAAGAATVLVRASDPA